MLLGLKEEGAEGLNCWDAREVNAQGSFCKRKGRGVTVSQSLKVCVGTSAGPGPLEARGWLISPPISQEQMRGEVAPGSVKGAWGERLTSSK